MKNSYNKTISKFLKEKTYSNTYINLTDNTDIEIENCKKILEYDDIHIRLRTSTLNLCIWGENLKISDYNTAGIIIRGNVSSIEFE